VTGSGSVNGSSTHHHASQDQDKNTFILRKTT